MQTGSIRSAQQVVGRDTHGVGDPPKILQPRASRAAGEVVDDVEGEVDGAAATDAAWVRALPFATGLGIIGTVRSIQWTKSKSF